MDCYDVVIVGGAAVGSAAAYFLGAHAGFGGSVLVLEQDPSYARCATTRSVASIRQKQGYNRIPLVLGTFADLDTPLSLYLKLANQSTF